MEIERKFVFKRLSTPILASASHHIVLRQGYTEDRIRFTERHHSNGKISYKINHKAGMGLSREEAQCEITKEVFDSIWNLTIGHRIYKTRYFFPLPGELELEVDVYDHAKIWPLTTAEIEFPSVEAAHEYDKKDLTQFCADFFEVTGEINYLNVTLAC
jgi:CYTH domain-containing protein